MYECFNCDIRWRGGFAGDINNDEHICKLCKRDCKEPWDKNKCPDCKKPTAMARPKPHISSMVCEHCKYQYTDKEAEATLGVKKVPTKDNFGNQITGYINTGDGHLKFHSWYCLKEFDNFEDMNSHDKVRHRLGDPMAGCIPSGYVVDLENACELVPCYMEWGYWWVI